MSVSGEMKMTVAEQSLEDLRSAEPEFDDSDVLEAKLDRAAGAFAHHRNTSVESRAQRLLRAAKVLERDADKLAELVTEETGKLLSEARAEALKCATVCRYYAQSGAAFLRDEPLGLADARSRLVYEPMGVLLAIMPWNFPLWQVFRCCAPALMAGNVLLLKHAENVPGCAEMLREILEEAGFRGGELQTIYPRVKDIAGLIEDPRVAAVTLTGSEAAGVSVGRAAGGAIKKVVLELGGRDAFIVMESADVKKAIKTGVRARMINCGQSCIAAKRFLFAEPVYAQCEQGLVEAMAGLRLGDPRDAKTDVGPMVGERFAAHLDEQVKAAVRAGARVLTGGKRSSLGGAYYEPTVLADVPRHGAITKEEFFGPVALVYRVKDAADAIAVANATPFGLGASVWTTDVEEPEKFVRELRVGQVFVNAMTASDARVPFGGTKRSGVGRELGASGMREFMQLKSVVYG